jgi:hypothetical protein
MTIILSTLSTLGMRGKTWRPRRRSLLVVTDLFGEIRLFADLLDDVKL